MDMRVCVYVYTRDDRHCMAGLGTVPIGSLTPCSACGRLSAAAAAAAAAVAATRALWESCTLRGHTVNKLEQQPLSAPCRPSRHMGQPPARAASSPRPVLPPKNGTPARKQTPVSSPLPVCPSFAAAWLGPAPLC
eukprot:1144737-Pelagomonas_calceolata.AAC.3